MSPEFHVCIRRILAKAVQLKKDAREPFIRQACARNPEILQEVRSLLPHYEKVQDFEPPRPQGSEWRFPGTTTLAKVSAEAVSSESAAAEPTLPFCLDGYHVFKVLGRGGMGIVYLATRIEPLGPPVAIKVLREGLLSAEDRWRFTLEAEILRHLHHPGIAQIKPAKTIGAAHETQPYFVMEYIQGEQLVKYAESNQLNVSRRLRLFAMVCEAVEYAHQRGIIHRDLKPDNIVVDQSGQPKILDFGIAQILASRSMMIHDKNGKFIGTPGYASPEQAVGVIEQLTPHSDVYSLGLIAHELLAGQVPRFVDGKMHLTLDGIALDGGSNCRSLSERRFRHYLTAILAMALHRNREKRYRSAGKFGLNIEILLSRCPPLSSRSILGNRLSSLLRWAGASTIGSHSRLRSKWIPSSVSRPLSAVLRRRIAMSLESDVRQALKPEETSSAQSDLSS